MTAGFHIELQGHPDPAIRVGSCDDAASYRASMALMFSSAVENYQADGATMLQRRSENADAAALVQAIGAHDVHQRTARSSGDAVALRKQSILSQSQGELGSASPIDGGWDVAAELCLSDRSGRPSPPYCSVADLPPITGVRRMRDQQRRTPCRRSVVLQRNGELVVILDREIDIDLVFHSRRWRRHPGIEIVDRLLPVFG